MRRSRKQDCVLGVNMNKVCRLVIAPVLDVNCISFNQISRIGTITSPEKTILKQGLHFLSWVVHKRLIIKQIQFFFVNTINPLFCILLAQSVSFLS